VFVPSRPYSAARDRILDVADRLFYERGIHAVGVDLIVAESGAAKTTLYSHFKTKDDLVAAYLERRCLLWRERLTAATVSGDDTPAARRLLRVFDVLGDWFAEPDFRGCPFINAMAEFTVGHPAAVVTATHRAGLRNLFEDLCQQAGIEKPHAVALQLTMLYDAAIITAYLDREQDAAATARAAAEALLQHHTAPV
jgi:AcrR family transcriptional regulator